MLKHRACRYSAALAVVWLVLSLAESPRATAIQYRFRTYGADQGLSNSRVKWGMLQDSRGFLWVPTPDGLNRFDGYGFRAYLSDDRDTNSLFDPVVEGLAEDSAGTIWVVSQRALHRIDRADGVLHRVARAGHGIAIAERTGLSCCRVGPDGATLYIGTRAGIQILRPGEQTTVPLPGSRYGCPELDSSEVGEMLLDSRNRLWFCSSFPALFEYDPAGDRMIRHPLMTPEGDSVGTARQAVEDISRKGLWLAVRKGLGFYSRTSNTFRRRTFAFGGRDEMSMKRLALAEDGTLWLANDYGLVHYYPDSDTFDLFRASLGDTLGLPSSNVEDVLIGRGHNLWIGTSNAGISRLYLRQKRFVTYNQTLDYGFSLQEKGVWGLAADSNGGVWLGLWGGGVCRLSRDERGRETLRQLPHGFSDPPQGISGANIAAVTVAPDGIVWVGASDGALTLHDPRTGSYRYMRPDHPDTAQAPSNWTIWSVLISRTGLVWLGQKNGMLDVFDPQSNRMVARHRGDNSSPDSLPESNFFALLEEPDGTMWIGSGHGLVRREPSWSHFKTYTRTPEDSTSISSNSVKALYRDNKGQLWVGTEGGGLCLFDDATETFRAYRAQDGLAGNIVVGIVEDNHGRLWLSCYGGLTRFDPRTEQFRTYSVSDGLQSRQFSVNSAVRAPDGRMYFGGAHGVNAFYPEEIADDTFEPPCVLTSLRLLNKVVHPGDTINGRVLLRRTIGETRELVLRHDDPMFSLEFAALQVPYPERVRYRYMLEGFAPELIHTDAAHRQAVYTSLPPGRYTFRVEATNSDGVWSSNAASLAIRVPPPFWATWWFRLLIAMGVVGAATAFYRRRTEAMAVVNRSLERRVDNQTQNLRELTGEIRGSAENLSGVADSLTDDARHTAGLAESMRSRVGSGVTSIQALREALQTLRSAAGETDGAVSDIARAVSELGTTIDAVTENCRREHQIVQRAQRKADTARGNADALQSIIAEVVTIVRVIGDIAESTDLLALNATIQASKAGAAGRGFGVVAREIKALAAETADATKQISDQFDSIRAAVERSTEQIMEITGDVGDISGALQSILASVDQQSQATQRIAQNIGSTTDSARHMRKLSDEGSATVDRIADDMHDVDAAAEETLQSVRSTREGIERMRNAMGSLYELTKRIDE